MQLEHFIRIVAGFININNSSINTLTKQFIDEIGLDAEFKNLIDLINYIRNTIHFGGIPTKNDTIVTYKGIDYIFKKGDILVSFMTSFYTF